MGDELRKPRLSSANLMLSNIDRGKFNPPSDVVVTDDRFIIRVEIAGMRAEAFRLTLAKRKLVISGIRQMPAVAATCSYHQMEIGTGEFRLQYTLSQPVDDKRVSANYMNGILLIELPFLPSKSVNVVDTS
jgi:HSP20 family protein